MCSPVTSLPQFTRGHFRIGQRGHYCLGLTKPATQLTDSSTLTTMSFLFFWHASSCFSSIETSHHAWLTTLVHLVAGFFSYSVRLFPKICPGPACYSAAQSRYHAGQVERGDA